jgi:hypothetical protein
MYVHSYTSRGGQSWRAVNIRMYTSRGGQSSLCVCPRVRVCVRAVYTVSVYNVHSVHVHTDIHTYLCTCVWVFGCVLCVCECVFTKSQCIVTLESIFVPGRRNLSRVSI